MKISTWILLFEKLKRFNSDELESRRRIIEIQPIEILGDFHFIIDFNDQSGWSIGRSYKDAPEVDNYVMINKQLTIGQFYDVKIKEAYEYDVLGEVV